MMKNGRFPLFIPGMIIVAVSLSRYGNFVSVKEKSLFAYFGLILYVRVNIRSVMFKRVFLAHVEKVLSRGWRSVTRGHNESAGGETRTSHPRWPV